MRKRKPIHIGLPKRMMESFNLQVSSGIISYLNKDIRFSICADVNNSLWWALYTQLSFDRDL